MNQQSGFNINELVREAQTRWLKPAEVLFILKNHEDHQIMNEPAQKPPSGSLFLFNKRVLRFFRKDGHSWRRKRDGRTVGEAHERLKVGNVEAINCYYAHGEQNPNFQRRSYWMLDPAYEHIVLVHYRDINEGRQNAGHSVSHSSPVSATFSPSSSAYSPQQISIGEFYEPYRNFSSPGSAEISSDVSIRTNGINHSDIVERTEEVNSASSLEMNQALRRLEEQLSLNDESLQEISPFYSENENSDEFGNVVWEQSSYVGMHLNPNSHQLQHHSGDKVDNHQLLRNEANDVWKDMLDNFENSQNVELHVKHTPDENGMLLAVSLNGNMEDGEDYTFLDFNGKVAQKGTYAYQPAISTYGTNPDDYTTVFDQGHSGTPLDDSLSLTIAQKQKFTIQEISPEWGYASETIKVLIIGYFLCDPLESIWTCMFGDVEVPVQIVQEGVLRCLAPPHLPGKVTLCITSGNRESCSEVRDFEYRDKPTASTHSNLPETYSRSPEELLLLVRFVQTLLSNSKMLKRDSAYTGIDLLSKSRASDDLWGQVIEALLVGTWTSTTTTNWLLQELLKDKLQQWLNFRSQEDGNQVDCSLSKKEQGIIHMIAGLGFEWALHPILKSGVSVNFRDINGWTALHWAARFGREKMVAALMASGASAEAVTDPNSQDPVGKTPASIAATYGHRGLAGYLSEKALTSHLSSLTLEETELSRGAANLEAERTINSVSNTSHSTNEDQLSLKNTLAAVRNAAQAAARIQSAFRAHSFRKRQQKEAATATAFASSSGDEYGITSNDIQGISAASKLAFRNSRDYNSAALSIQKKYRGWKGRKDFLAFRQKVVKIQAHIRGYQVRKQYKVCWAVGILEKVVLRWRRRGVGLRGFRHETESIDETDDEDILKIFRKQKVDAALDEAVNRVLIMVECPEARQQYHRILEKYRQAKAELEGVESEKAQASNDGVLASNDGVFYVENYDEYQFP